MVPLPHAQLNLLEILAIWTDLYKTSYAYRPRLLGRGGAGVGGGGVASPLFGRGVGRGFLRT